MENNHSQPASEPTSKELIASVIPEDGGVEATQKKHKNDGSGKLVFEFNRKTFRYIIAAAAAIILIAWGINHTDRLSGIISGFFSLISPFILGFCFAFVINVLMRPLEKVFDKIFKKCKETKRAKARCPVCLILSTVIIIGLLFACFKFFLFKGILTFLFFSCSVEVNVTTLPMVDSSRRRLRLAIVSFSCCFFSERTDRLFLLRLFLAD